MDNMTDQTLEAMKASADFKTDFKAAEYVEFKKPEPVVEPEPPQVSSYAERSTAALQSALTAKAKNDAEARESLAAQRGESKTRTHTSEEKQKGDAFRRSMNAYLGHIREAEIAKGVPENQATKLIAEPVAPDPNEKCLDNTDGSTPGPTIQILDNQEAMHRLFTVGSFADGTRVVGDEKGIRIA